MGKNLKGKQLGTGISQRKDGLYTARFTTKGGQRKQKYFKKLQECKNWLAEAQFQDEHGNVLFGDDPTVEAWFDYWITHIKGDNIRYHTSRTYKDRYCKNIKPVIGDMLLRDVKPLHCQDVLNRMVKNYSNETIERTRTVMYSILDSAMENELIFSNPVKKSVKAISRKQKKERRVLTTGEQQLFLKTTQEEKYYNQYAFILQTGIRVGELIGLKWEDIDFAARTVSIHRTMYGNKKSGFKISDTKTTSGQRVIPLTEEALKILKEQKRVYTERQIISLEYSSFVFLNKKGVPITREVYDKAIIRYAEKIGIERFSMHTLRHTFATRCIEAGMRPKTLQMILGHANISMTMDLYVHVTEEEKIKEIKNVETMLKLV